MTTQLTTQLAKQDTRIFAAAGSDRHASMALGAVAVVNGAVPDYELIKELLAERIQPIFDSTCVESPRDVARHVQRMALPAPSDEAELFQAIAHALERPLDLDRPLWECWIIEGLKDNHWAILIKIHHSIADGISAAHLLTRLCDDAECDAFTNHTAAKHVSPSPVEGPSWADTLWQTPVGVLKTATRVITGAATSLITAAAAVAPAVDPSTTMRRYRTVCIPRAAVDDITRKFGVTSDDVALAAITEGFRTVLVRNGEEPRADSLRTLGPALPYLPVEHRDPIRQLRAVHSASRAQPNTQRSTEYSPIDLCARAIHALTQLRRQELVTLATNAPGPRQRLRVLGQRMERVLPIPPTALRLSTGVAVLSYGDELIFGITADYGAAPDMEHLAAGIEMGMARLVALSKDSVVLFDRRRKRPRKLPNNAIRWRPSAPPARVRH